MNATDLVDTSEMYLKAVLELEEEGVTPLRARLAERFMQSGPTVSQTVARLQRDGLVTLAAPSREVMLTPVGRGTAETIMRKHRLAEVFLDRVVGLEWKLLHVEACRWEHVMSDRVESLLIQALGSPARSPYGNPIAYGPEHPDPAVASLAAHAAAAAAAAAAGAAAVAGDGAEDDADDAAGQSLPVRGTVLWIGEPLQADPEALTYLHRAGLLPDAEMSFVRAGESVLAYVGADGSEVVLPRELALHVFARRK